MKFWIIEHPTRGIYMGHDYAKQSGNWGPTFSYIKARTDGHAFFSKEMAVQALDKFPANVKARCYVVAFNTHRRGY